MKKTLIIIPVLIAVILSPLIPGGDSVMSADVKLEPVLSPLDEYSGDELTKISDTQYKIEYPGTGSRIEIGSIDKEVTEFKPDITISHWNDEVSFSLIAPAAIDSKSELTADMFSDFITDKIIASNDEWNFEYYAVQPHTEFSEYGGIDMIITAKEKPSSNKIYFTYDSTTVTPYYQGELTAEEIKEGGYRPDHVIGSIAFYANDKANYAIGDINYKTGKVGHLYAMYSNGEWCRWSIEGDYIVLTIPDNVFNGNYPVVISPVGDTFGYTSVGSSFAAGSADRILGSSFSAPANGTANSISCYILSGDYDDGPCLFMIYDDTNGDAYMQKTAVLDPPGLINDWNTEDLEATQPSIVSGNSYWLYHWGEEYSLKYDSTGVGGFGTQAYPDTPPATFTVSDYSWTFSIYCTYTPGVGGNDPPTVTTDNSTSVEETTATLYGNITDTGGENADIRGFQWGTSTGVYTTNVTDSGNFSTGSYNLGATGLPEGDLVYWRSEAHNSEGWGYGGELTLHTKPVEPDTLAVTGQDDESIDLSWNKGTGSENTTIRYRTDQYPTDYNDGTSAYNDTGTTCTVSGLSPGQIYYFRAWSISTDDDHTYSDSYAQVIDYTLPADPANLALSNPTCNTLDAEWTAGTGGDKSMVRWKEGGYPADETDGTQAYFDTSNSTTITSLSDTTLIYVAVFAYDSDSGYYSSGSSQDSENTTATANPTFTTDNATLVTATTARLNGTISALNCENASDVFWEWGLATGNYTANYTDITDYGNGAVYYDLESLNASTTYYYRGAARLDGGAWQYGGEISFTTTTNYPPTVTTANATDLYCNSVTGNGNITDVGSANATQRGFQYGIGGFTANVSETGTFTAGVFDLSITGLLDNTEYQYRAFAVNIYGIAYGDSVNFTTTASSDPTFTTSNATSITNTTARLNGTISGLDCENADDTFWEWGLSTGNYTANYTDTTNRGNSAVYHDLSSLSANTTYYFRGAARLNGGSWQYGSEFYFTTTNITGCGEPSGFTVTALTDSHIKVEWDTVDNVTGYLLLVSNTGYPASPTGSYAVAYNGTDTSATLVGYNLEFNKYYFSLWTHCNPYSDDYVTASIGGDAMSDLTAAFTPFLTFLPVLLIVALFTILAALAAKFIPILASPLFLLAAPISMYAGCNLYDNYVSNVGMGVGLALILYSFVCFIFAIITQFRRREESF